MESDRSLRQVQHAHPIWREQSDFIIAVRIDAAGTDVRSEQVWARQISAHVFEICCIPFFAYDLALGDRVETGEDYVIARVLKQSGRYVFRVILPTGSSSEQQMLVDSLRDVDAQFEWYSTTLVSIDIPTEDQSQRAAQILWERELAGDWTYETGRMSAEGGSNVE